jgi:hypothetical protein
MPTVRKLELDEIQVIENKGKGLRKIIEEEYDAFLAGYDAGEYGEALLDPAEKRLTVRNRFKAAAARRGVGLQFIRMSGDVLRFKVVANGQAAAAAEPPAVASDTPPAAGRGRGGRKKKSATSS